MYVSLRIFVSPDSATYTSSGRSKAKAWGMMRYAIVFISPVRAGYKAVNERRNFTMEIEHNQQNEKNLQLIEKLWAEEAESRIDTCNAGKLEDLSISKIFGKLDGES
jgi:hypothetical protein